MPTSESPDTLTKRWVVAPRCVSISILLVTLACFGGCELSKKKLDREVDRLCAIDGGFHIYETVTLPKKTFGPAPNFEVFFEHRMESAENGRLGSDYQLSRSNEIITRDGSAYIQKFRTMIYRKSDKKLLAEINEYGRSGGHILPDFMYEKPSKSCQSYGTDVPYLNRIFLKGE